MTATQAEIESRAIELAKGGFEAFCKDISGMFGVSMSCTAQETVVETIKGLSERFTKLVAVNSVTAEGVLEGTFQLVFDQGGLFTTAGVIVMLPERNILAEIKRGTIEDLESMKDAIKETGNLLVGAWDRVFREGLEGHGHFEQTDVFIGEAWDNPQDAIGLAGDEECICVPFEMIIDRYPAFTCGVIYPKSIFEGAAEGAAGQSDSAESDGDEEGQEANAADADGSTEQEAASDDSKHQDGSARAGRSFSIGQGGLSDLLDARAEEIMDTEVVWLGPEDSVQNALTAMQEHNVGHLMVGVDGVLEGIVSNSNIAGAVSPYLRPVFAKWRRPIDDATLNIKVKWIMTRPVHTVRSDSPVAVVIEDMRQFGTRCLPVVDEDGKICGLVSTFDILTVLNGSSDISSRGKVVQAPAMAV